MSFFSLTDARKVGGSWGVQIADDTEYESEEDEERVRLEAEEEAKASALAKKAQEEAELARKEADRVRKEREEAERKEREKAEAEAAAAKRKQEEDERKKREAEVTEHEKKFHKDFSPVFSVIRGNGEREKVTEKVWMCRELRFNRERSYLQLMHSHISSDAANEVLEAIEANGLACGRNQRHDGKQKSR